MSTIDAGNAMMSRPMTSSRSDVAAEIDRGIRETIKGIRLSILAMGVGLANMKIKDLYKDLGCETMTMYVRKLCAETKMDQRSIFNWLLIGETFVKYRTDLEKIGFSDNDGPSKLPFLDRALEKNRRNEVFGNIKKMSVRDFIAFSRGLSCRADDCAEKPFVTVKEGNIYVNGILAVKINKRLDKKTFAYFRKVFRTASRAMEEGELLFPVQLRNSDELLRYRRASRYLLEKLRKTPV